MRRQVLGTFAALSAILAASLLLPLPGADGRIARVPDFCPFYRLTGLPCPGCGLTRAFVCLGHGHWSEALHWHPMGWLVYAVCGLLWLRTGLTLARGCPFSWPAPRVGSRLSLMGALTLLLVGVARMVWLTVRHQAF